MSYRTTVPLDQTITLTFSDVVENHVGMEKTGVAMPELGQAITPEYLSHLSQAPHLVETAEHISLNLLPKELPEGYEQEDFEPASILILRGWCTNADALWEEMTSLEWDAKSFMYGKVVNKKARHNLCFADWSAPPNYSAGQGTVVAFQDLPELSKVRAAVADLMPALDTEPLWLNAEGNYYYRQADTYIGPHGDTERNLVVGLRLGGSRQLVYQWYCQSKTVGPTMIVELHHGDVYIMSHKAVGTDWKSRKITTLRHSVPKGL